MLSGAREAGGRRAAWTRRWGRLCIEADEQQQKLLGRGSLGTARRPPERRSLFHRAAGGGLLRGSPRPGRSSASPEVCVGEAWASMRFSSVNSSRGWRNVDDQKPKLQLVPPRWTAPFSSESPAAGRGRRAAAANWRCPAFSWSETGPQLVQGVRRSHIPFWKKMVTITTWIRSAQELA